LGQIEEVIAMAKDERELVDYYYGTTCALSLISFHHFYAAACSSNRAQHEMF
jgi:hypothetical protein